MNSSEDIVHRGQGLKLLNLKTYPMRIAELSPLPNWVLSIIADDSRTGTFDVSPYLEYESFEALRDYSEFLKVFNGGYFVEWDCGADLSVDTIEARWQVVS